jgi:hypothetical protein
VTLWPDKNAGTNVTFTSRALVVEVLLALDMAYPRIQRRRQLTRTLLVSRGQSPPRGPLLGESGQSLRGVRHRERHPEPRVQ